LLFNKNIEFHASNISLFSVVSKLPLNFVLLHVLFSHSVLKVFRCLVANICTELTSHLHKLRASLNYNYAKIYNYISFL